MRPTLLLLSCIALLDPVSAASVGGRWEGVVRVPERALPIVVDLARSGDGWAGSIILTGLGIKGAPLSNVVVSDDASAVAFDLGTALASDAHGAAALKLAATADTMTGEMRQAGNVARVTLRRTGEAQVEPVAASTPVRARFEHEWTGQYELGGYPRNVTLTLRNRAEGGATADWLIVGKQTTRLPVDRVTEDGDYVRVESQAFRATFEGRLIANQIQGTIELGALELPIVLRRAEKRP